MSLFRQGWKAESVFGDDVTAHHMNTRSVYRFKENIKVSITHSAKYVGDESVDQFAVTYTMVTALHPNGNVLSSVTRTVGNFDGWLDAYYCAIEYIRHISK